MFHRTGVAESRKGGCLKTELSVIVQKINLQAFTMDPATRPHEHSAFRIGMNLSCCKTGLGN